MCFRAREWRVVEESKKRKLTVNGLKVGVVATADAVVCRFSSKSPEGHSTRTSLFAFLFVFAFSFSSTTAFLLILFFFWACTHLFLIPSSKVLLVADFGQKTFGEGERARVRINLEETESLFLPFITTFFSLLFSSCFLTASSQGSASSSGRRRQTIPVVLYSIVWSLREYGK